MPATSRAQACLQRFDALQPLEAVVLTVPDGGAAEPLLDALQTERPGHFEWNVLEDGPAAFRVEVLRRTVAGPRNVTEYLSTDHRRLDQLMSEVQQHLVEGNLPGAARTVAEFHCGLARHIDAEEEALFPVFEDLHGFRGNGPTFVMRAEHVDLLRLLREASAALAEGHGAAALTTATRLLEAHNAKEERILYPMTDRALADELERDELVKRLQRQN